MKPSYSKIINIFFSLVFLICASHTFAQTITDVRFIGLTRTKYSYLRDHIVKTKSGQQVDSVKLKRDVQEIYNLRHFSSVKFVVVPSADTNFVEVQFVMEETFSLFPVLDLGITKDFFKIQAGAVDFNSFGRSGNTSLYVRRLGRMTYLFNGDYPYLLKGKHGIAADINKVGTYEPIYNGEKKNEFSYDLYTFLVMHRYDFNSHAFTKIGLGYQYETYRPHVYAGLPSEYILKNSAERFVFRLNYRYTKINLNRINQNGYFIELTYNQILSSVKNELLQGNSKKLLADIRYYGNLFANTNIAMRMRAGLGRSSLFDQFVLDDNTNMRGIGFKRVRIDNEFVLNFEIRQSIFKHRQGIIQAVLFNDFNPDYNFIGGGIRTYLEQIHGVVLRFDYGMNSRNLQQGGVVAGIHQYF